MARDVAGDIRLDPRVKAFLADGEFESQGEVDSRETLLAEANSDHARADVEGFPPVVISVNECDPLRDEGVNFYRLLLAAGVPARCRQVMGTMHAVETFITVCPEISRDTARDLAAFCAGS